MSASNGTIELTWKPVGRGGNVLITAGYAEKKLRPRKLDVFNEQQCRTFVDEAGALGGERGRKARRENLTRELEALAREFATRTDDRPPSQAALLVDLAQNVEFFHNPDRDPFATIDAGGHRETHPLNSKGFRLWLGRLFWQKAGRAAGSQAMQDALDVLAGRAVFEGKMRQTSVRVAEHEGAVYLDLADDQWRSVRVTAEGWEIDPNPPVKFLRRPGALPLPVPVPGGSIDDLRELVNVPGEDEWLLVKGYLLGALNPAGPYPILAPNGEHGSAKTTLCRLVRAMIDPNEAPLRSPPRDERDLIIAASNGWNVAYDNLSTIPFWLADALCRLATGAGFGTRELFTNQGEKLFSGARPIILNGIEDLTTREDLADRLIAFTLPPIPDNKRCPEKELLPRFEAARPRILGAMLDGVSRAIRERHHVKLAAMPRMADFAKWVAAAIPAAGATAEAFLAAYRRNRESLNSSAIETSPAGPAIVALVDSVKRWEGTAKDLLAALADGHTDQKTRERKDWPESPRALSGALRRLTPNLRVAGIAVTFQKHQRTGTPIVLERVGETPSRPSQPSPKPTGGSETGGAGDEAVTVDSPARPASSQTNPLFDTENGIGDGRDDCDGAGPECSDPPAWTPEDEAEALRLMAEVEGAQ